MSQIDVAVEKVRNLNRIQVEALLDWLKLREDPTALQHTIDAEIELGLKDALGGRVFHGDQVHAELRERSRKRRAVPNG
jgi:predicted transcriptional regulator